MTAYTIDFNPIIQLTDDQFYQLCRANPELKFERNAQGELIITELNQLTSNPHQLNYTS